MADNISSHVIRCIGVFRALVDSSDDPDLNFPDPGFQLQMVDEFARFKVWVGNIGAHRTGMSSLDYRLRDASHIRKQIINLLEDLIELIKDASAIAKGEKVPWDQDGEEEEEDIEFSDSDDDSPDTELGQIAESMADVVNCLLRLTVTIRNAAPHDRYKGARATDTTHFEAFDVQHVRSKFDHVEPWLADRLGKAISRRRQYLKYRESHHQKLSHGLLDGDALEKETIASSIPDHLKDGKSQAVQGRLNVLRDDSSDAGLSQTSYATSAAVADRLTIPPLPKEAHAGPFQCGFCYMIIVAKDRMAWKKHVYGDLQPYVCLEPNCLTPEREYLRRHEWIEHVRQNHWVTYNCVSCNSAFSSPADCKHHLEICHPAQRSPAELDALVKLSRQPIDFKNGVSCPLCRETLRSVQQYQRHVGRHQEQLSLFALPSLETEEDEDRRDVGSDESDGVNSAEMQRDDISVDSEHSARVAALAAKNTTDIKEAIDLQQICRQLKILVDAGAPEREIEAFIASEAHGFNKYVRLVEGQGVIRWHPSTRAQLIAAGVDDKWIKRIMDKPGVGMDGRLVDSDEEVARSPRDTANADDDRHDPLGEGKDGLPVDAPIADEPHGISEVFSDGEGEALRGDEPGDGPEISDGYHNDYEVVSLGRAIARIERRDQELNEAREREERGKPLEELGKLLEEQVELLKDKDELERIKNLEQERRREKEQQEEEEYKAAKKELERRIRAEEELDKEKRVKEEAKLKAALAELERIEEAKKKKANEERIKRELELKRLEEAKKPKEEKARREKEAEEAVSTGYTNISKSARPSSETTYVRSPDSRYLRDEIDPEPPYIRSAGDRHLRRESEPRTEGLLRHQLRENASDQKRRKELVASQEAMVALENRKTDNAVEDSHSNRDVDEPTTIDRPLYGGYQLWPPSREPSPERYPEAKDDVPVPHTNSSKEDGSLKVEVEAFWNGTLREAPEADKKRNGKGKATGPWREEEESHEQVQGNAPDAGPEHITRPADTPSADETDDHQQDQGQEGRGESQAEPSDDPPAFHVEPPTPPPEAGPSDVPVGSEQAGQQIAEGETASRHDDSQTRSYKDYLGDVIMEEIQKSGSPDEATLALLNMEVWRERLEQSQRQSLKETGAWDGEELTEEYQEIEDEVEERIVLQDTQGLDPELDVTMAEHQSVEVGKATQHDDDLWRRAYAQLESSRKERLRQPERVKNEELLQAEMLKRAARLGQQLEEEDPKMDREMQRMIHQDLEHLNLELETLKGQERQRKEREAEEAIAAYKAKEAERIEKEKKEKVEREAEYNRRLREQPIAAGLDKGQISTVTGKDNRGKETRDQDGDRPIWTRMSLRHLDTETLEHFKIDWEHDSEDPAYVLIKRWVPEDEQIVLWEHTRGLRVSKAGKPGSSKKPTAEAERKSRPSLSEFEFVRKPRRGRSKSPGLLMYLAGSRPS